MRYDKKRNDLNLKDLIGGTITATGYMELTIEKDGKKYKLIWDYEYGYYDDVSITYEIKEVQ